jgi:hypothetical protein
VPEIPDAAVQLVAERALRHHKAAHPESHLTWRDFAGDARADLEAAAPLLAEAWGVTEPQAGSYQSAVQSIPCPSCGARAGEACRTAFIGHAARKRALAAARDVPEVSG